MLRRSSEAASTFHRFISSYFQSPHYFPTSDLHFRLVMIYYSPKLELRISSIMLTRTDIHHALKIFKKDLLNLTGLTHSYFLSTSYAFTVSVIIVLSESHSPRVGAQILVDNAYYYTKMNSNLFTERAICL